MSDDGGAGWAAVVEALKGVSAVISTISASVISLREGVDDLKQEVADLKKEVAVIRSDILSVRTDVMSRMDRLQDKLSAVTDDLTVNFASSMKSDRLARNTMEETRALADEVTALRAQVRRLSAKIFGPDDLH